MRLLLAAFAVFLIATPASAQHHGEHEPHRNYVALFTGLTHEERRDNAFTLGLEYARAVGARVTIGALAEHAFGDHSFWILAVPFGYKLGQWRAIVAPGVELAESESHNLVRLGIEYEFVVDGWEVAPAFGLDFVEEDVIPIYGVVFARGF
jgi:hypothetical protein